MYCVSVHPDNFGIDEQSAYLLLHWCPPAGFKAVSVYPADFEAVHPTGFKAVHPVSPNFEVVHPVRLRADNYILAVTNWASPIQSQLAHLEIDWLALKKAGLRIVP